MFASLDKHHSQPRPWLMQRLSTGQRAENKGVGSAHPQTEHFHQFLEGNILEEEVKIAKQLEDGKVL